MKTLEEIIQQKCKFLGNSQIPYELYNFTVPTNTTNDITLFLTNSNIETESIITLLEEMIPLFVYIFSCLKYYDISRTADLDLKLKFHDSSLKYKEFIDLSGDFLDNPIERLTSKRSLVKNRGYYNTFKEPFRVKIILSIIYMSHIFGPIANQTEEFTYEEENQTEEFTYEEENQTEEYEPEDEEDEEEEEVINVTKTFKTEECVICIENGPNILFCNCGHLCRSICNNCLEFKKNIEMPRL